LARAIDVLNLLALSTVQLNQTTGPVFIYVDQALVYSGAVVPTAGSSRQLPFPPTPEKARWTAGSRTIRRALPRDKVPGAKLPDVRLGWTLFRGD
jgi:hypothetical protein